jgi:hypothetical protein
MTNPDHCVARTWKTGPLGEGGMTQCPNKPSFAINGKGSCGAHIVQVLRRELDTSVANGATSVPVCHWEDRPDG